MTLVLSEWDQGFTEITLLIPSQSKERGGKQFKDLLLPLGSWICLKL